MDDLHHRARDLERRAISTYLNHSLQDKSYGKSKGKGWGKNSYDGSDLAIRDKSGCSPIHFFVSTIAEGSCYIMIYMDCWHHWEQ